MMKGEKKKVVLHLHATVSKLHFPYTGAQTSSTIAGVEFGGGWGATCLSGNQRAMARPGSAQRCCPWQGGIGKPVLWQTLILL